MLIKNLDLVGRRILQAIQLKENIILYGDADLDGIASTIILKEAIENLNGEISSFYFPDREKEGYGINKKALNYLRRFSPGLLIALDLGISNFEEVKLAKKLGFEVIIIDHHEILKDQLPKGALVVDPKQKTDSSSFKELATAGIVFKLTELLFEMENIKFPKGLRKSFLELAALATLADLMPQVNENKEIIQEGLESLKNTSRPGLKIFWQEKLASRSNKNFLSKTVSILNTSLSENHCQYSFLLLTAQSLSEAKKFLQLLVEKNKEKMEKIHQVFTAIEEKIYQSKEKIIFEGNESWPITILGSVATRLCQKYQKPTFLFSQGKKESRGAVRTLDSIDSIKILNFCSKYLKRYGGHPRAAGFSLTNKNLEEFRNCLMNYFSKNESSKKKEKKD